MSLFLITLHAALIRIPMKRSKIFTAFYLPGIAFFLLVFMIRCQEDFQNIPIIEEVTVTPDTVDAGGVVLLITKASDADGEDLVYSYSLNAGNISGYGDSVYWLAPLTGGQYRAIVRVTDPAGNQSVDSVKIFVIDSGKSPITGTASFPEDLNFDLSSAKVRLFTSIPDRVAGHCTDSVQVFGFGPIVSFTFPAVDPGYYYLDVWKDMDNSITLSSGDFLGWYGSGDYYSPMLKPIVVQQGIPAQVQVQANVIP
jgi:hypothetical protein